MSLYKDYLEERTNKHVLESQDGFAVYSFVDEGCYIEDIYTVPSARQMNVAASFADQIAAIAKEKGVGTLIGTVAPSAKGSTNSLKVLLAYGFQLHSSVQNLIVFKKEIL